MAKVPQKQSNKKVQSNDTAKYILIAVVLIIAGYFIYTQFIKKDEVVTGNVIDPRERIKNIKEPVFKKEGELEFLGKNKKDTIRKIEIELAESDEERMQGMMYRRSMDDNKGMLFIFETEEPQSFWMKNTIIPLDIMFVNAKKEIIKIHKSTTPFSEKSYPSEKPATYVVEVSGGFADKYGIKEGDLISFAKQ